MSNKEIMEDMKVVRSMTEYLHNSGGVVMQEGLYERRRRKVAELEMIDLEIKTIQDEIDDIIKKYDDMDVDTLDAYLELNKLSGK